MAVTVYVKGEAVVIDAVTVVVQAVADLGHCPGKWITGIIAPDPGTTGLDAGIGGTLTLTAGCCPGQVLIDLGVTVIVGVVTELAVARIVVGVVVVAVVSSHS